jgi:exportin-2 (importin alpha re-exporter)
MADPAAMAQLAQLLSQTANPANTQAMQAATEQLRNAEVKSGFGLLILKLLTDASVDPGARQAGAIYFKNYVKRQWSVESSVGGIAVTDRQAIKENLLSLMLQAPKPVQVQLGAGLEEISLTDYPEEWPTLLNELVGHLRSSQDMAVLKGTMETAHRVFMKFRSKGRSNEVLKEIKYTVLGFQETHLAVFKAACQRALTTPLPPDQLTTHFELLLSTVGVFYSFHVVDLPEFFEDHRQDYFGGFLEILKFHNEAVAGSGEQEGLLEQVKGVICQSLALYTDKYQEEFTPFLMPVVSAVWTLLTGLDAQEKNDQLVAKGIHFLSSAAATHWQQSPFEDPNVLSGICEKIVFPNIILRDSDVELFEDNPQEYVRRDMEGADQDTRRRSSMDLVKAMGRLNEAKVTEILTSNVRTLMEQARSVPPEKAERFKDACIYISIAMAVRGSTQRDGVTQVNANVNVLDFYNGLVQPELQPGAVDVQPLLRASCLKFVTVFRNQIPLAQIGAILQAICAHVGAKNPVVHTYAAICVEKLITVKDRNAAGVAALRYDPAVMKGPLLQMVGPILQLIAANRGIAQNEYLMRAVARIFSFLKQHGAEAGLQTLPPLAAILNAASANPTNPTFNHNIFEAIASIVKVCVPSQPDAVENALLPVFGQILEKNVTDFLPYTFQILGLLLDATSSVKPLYQQLFARLLTADLWRAQANVPGLIRLLRAYFTKHAVFGDLLRAHLQQILERFQFVLCNRKTEASAFELLTTMYVYLPLEFYQQHVKTLLTVLLTRLQSSKSPKFTKDFVVSCSLFVHRDPGNTFPAALNEIQQGLLINLLSQFWLPACKMSLRLDERKVCAMGMCKLLAQDSVRTNPQA